MNQTNIRRTLWESLDLYCVRHDVTLVLIVVPVVMGLYGLLSGSHEGWTAVLVLSAILLLPFLIWFLWELCRVYRKPDAYILCKAKLTQPHSITWGHGIMYFTVVLEHPELGQCIVNTRPIFQTRGWLNPRLEDYLNKTVTIAYNEETETVVVIG